MNQLDMENTFGKHNRNKLIKEVLEDTDFFLEEVENGTNIIKDWLNEDFYESKRNRLDLIKDLDFEQLVSNVFIQSTQFYIDMPLVSAAAMLAGPLEALMDKAYAILTMAEILSLLTHCDMYQVYRGNNQQMCIRPLINLGEELEDKLNSLMYLPPMVEKPRKLKANNHSAHYSKDKDTVFAGSKYNYHDGEVGLDVINRQNAIKYSIDYRIIDVVEEEPSEATEEDLWEQYIAQRDFNHELMKQYEKVYIPNRIDARGRIYTQGHHFNPQGDSYHKAMMQLAKKEVVEGW